MNMKKRKLKDTKFGVQNLYRYTYIKCSLQVDRIRDL